MNTRYVQIYRLTKLCVLRWTTRLHFAVNRLWQYSHLYGRSLRCNRWWSIKLNKFISDSIWLKSIQILQLHVTTNLCLCLKALGQYWHLYGLSFVCVLNIKSIDKIINLITMYRQMYVLHVYITWYVALNYCFEQISYHKMNRDRRNWYEFSVHNCCNINLEK